MYTSIPLNMKVLDEKASSVSPTNTEVAEILVQMESLAEQLKVIRLNCSHEFYPAAYRESEYEGGSMVGIFNIATICKKCSTETTLINSAPLCENCNQTLELMVWQRRCLQKNNASSFLSAWEDEWKRRRLLWWEKPKEYGQWFLQFGLYTCINKSCSSEAVPIYLVTPGDQEK